MRKRNVVIAILVVVAVLVAAALIVPHIIDINRYHDQIQAQLEKRLGRQVSLGKMDLSLFPPAFEVEDATIAEDPHFTTGRPFASTQKLAVSVAFWPLLRKEVEVKSLELDRPLIELVRNEQGVWNYASLGQSKPSPAAPALPAAPAKPAAPQAGTATGQPAAAPVLPADLVIRDGQVAVTDLQKREARTVYDHIDLKVSDFEPNQQFSIKAAANLPGPGTQSLSLKGKAGPLKNADFTNMPFDGEFKMDQVSITGVQKFLNLEALAGTEAQVTGEAKVRNAAGRLASSGTIRLENPKVRNVTVGYPITLDYDVTDELSKDYIQVRKADLKLGATPISCSGSINAAPTPMQIDLRLAATNASIGEMARLASAFGVAFGKDMAVTGQITTDLQARGLISNPSLNGRASARDLVISGKDLPQPVKIGAVQLTLTPEAIRSNEFSATAGSTSVMVDFALSQYTSPNSSINAGVRAPNARLGEILDIARAVGVSAAEGVSGDGAVSLDVHVQGPTKNMSALSFSGTGKLQKASLKLPSFTKPMQVHNADIHFSQNSIALQNAAVGLGQSNFSGELTLKNFAEPQVQFNLNADKINVAEMQQLYVTTAPAKRAAARGFWQMEPLAWADAAPGPAAGAGLLTRMTGGGNLSAGVLQYDDLVLTNVRAKVALDHGVVRMDPVTADVYGGKETGNIVMDLRPALPVYSVNLKTEKVDANRLVSSVSDLKQTLYGLLAANVNASFSSTTADSIARSLNGKMDLNLTNGKLMHLDMLNELAKVGQFLGKVPGKPQGYTNVTQLTGNFDIRNGVAQTNNLKAVIDGGTMAATGLVNLADQSLNLRVTAVLNKAMSQQVGGTQVGGFMNTALANNQGELVLPVIVTGTFQHPQVAPDVQQIARMKLENLLPTSKNPGQFTSGILGKILGGKEQGGKADGQQALEGILGAIGGKQKPQPTATPSQDKQQTQPQPKQHPLGSVLEQMMGRKKASPTPTPKP